MPKLFITGDTHGHVQKLEQLQGAAFDDDIVIISGDFGVLWNPKSDREEEHILSWLSSQKFTTVFVDGNHENFNRLDALPTKDFFGANVGVVTPKVLHLKRGEILHLGGLTVLGFGGALSTDKLGRIEGVSVWSHREIPSVAECTHCMDKINSVKNYVDIIVTHTMPMEAVEELLGTLNDRYRDPTAQFLQHLYDNIDYEFWFCGHFHKNSVFLQNREKKVICLYDMFVEVKF